MSNSIADRFIAVMADIRAMDTESDNPMRHEVLSIQNAALNIIGAAIQEAHNLARNAKYLRSTCADAVKEALDQQAKCGDSAS